MAKSNQIYNPEPLWYKDAIIYELHIKSFFDSTNDGIGDFRGLIEKLDYLESLGVTAIWILPFYPSPLRDDGYDIADYFNIHPDYGIMRDFKRFLREAHARNLKVITELVVNHTSDQHQWFQRARRAKPGSVQRDYYVWSDSPDKFKDARIIFKDFETSNWSWDPVAKAYYWHRFYSHQPDLNYDNPKVRKEIFRILDYWFGMGVDGLRLDAIPYLYQRENTNCENLPETHEFLKKLRSHVDRKFSNRLLLAEANQWPEDAAAYLGEGDECHMAFHFPVMPRLFMALRMEDRFPIIDIMEQTPPIPDNSQWAIFLRNHDELTLEMVTDEERDYMYRIYAQDPRARINLGIRRRLAPLLGNNRRKIELMNILLFSLPGTPVIYYGDEIGMGDNYYLGDRDGVRTPMQWSTDRNAGFSKANPQKLYLPVIIDPEYHFEAVNVETQDRNLSSLLWWMKRVIGMRKHFRAFSRGSLEFVNSDNPKVLTFIRQYENELILVVINLSRFTQVVTIHIPEFEGYAGVEVFSQNEFPKFTQEPYVMTIGPYGHYWLELTKEKTDARLVEGEKYPELDSQISWLEILNNSGREILENKILPAYVKKQRWFGGKARNVRSVQIQESLSLQKNNSSSRFLLIEINYATGAPDHYSLPVTFITEEESQLLTTEFRDFVIAKINSAKGNSGYLCDAICSEQFRSTVLAFIAGRKKVKGKNGYLTSFVGKRFKELLGDKKLPLDSRVMKVEQSNSSVLYDQTFYMKLYRRSEEGINPDAEMIEFLTNHTSFNCVPPYAGSLEFRKFGADPQVLSLVQGFVPNEGDAWNVSLDAARRYFERALSLQKKSPDVEMHYSEIFNIDFETVPELFQDLIGVYLDQVNLLGTRTGEMHIALSSSHKKDLEPEPFSMLYQKSLYQSLRSTARRGIQFLQKSLVQLPETSREEAKKVVRMERDILKYFQSIQRKKINSLKTRIHGDYHLGQILFTGKDFIIIDFEGEPARPASERRLKYSPLRDTAGMLRSFHYAVYSVFFERLEIQPEEAQLLVPWIHPWYYFVSGIFLNAYLKTTSNYGFVPREEEDLKTLLNIFLVDKAVYEIGYELNNRPDWLIIPIEGIKMIMNELNP